MLKNLHLKSLLLLAVMLILGGNFALAVTWTWTAASGDLGTGIGKGTLTSGGKTWDYTRTLVSGESYTGFSSSCIQLGKNGGVENITLSTSDFGGDKITSVSVECSSYKGNHKVAISVGGTTYLAETATATWTTVSAKSGTGTSTGEIVIAFTGGSRALYIKSITVEYEKSTKPEINANDVNLAYNATSGEISYTIANTSGASLTAAKTTDDWISNVTVVGAKVTFVTTVNNGAERNGTITLSYTGADDKEVTVTQAAPPIAVTGITLPSKANVEEGGTITLKPTIVPANATNQNVTWESSDEDVASVSDGVVTGKNTGTARITATTEDGHKTAYCDVTVITAATPDEEFEFSTMGYENAADITNVAGTNVNLLFAKASGQNAPKYYTTGTGARMYADNTLTITSTKVIKKIVFTFHDTYVGALSADKGEYADGVWTGAESNIVFTNESNSHARIQKIAVYFKNEEILVSAAGFATFCSPFALDFTDVSTIEAYTAEIKGSNVEFTKVEGSVPANTGLLVKAAAEGIYEVPAVASSTTKVSDNKLVGVIDATCIDGTSGNYYVLKQKDKNVGFYKVTSASYTVRANSAYLALPAGSAKEFIGFGDETAVEAVAAEVLPTGTAYNLQGQRVGNDYKGVVIVNGKKVIR